MNITLETHQFAPELNQAIYTKKGRIMGKAPAPGVFRIQDYRKKHHKKATKGRYFKIEYINSEKPSLNRVYSGLSTYKGCKVLLTALEKRHNMPGGKFKTSIKVIG